MFFDAALSIRLSLCSYFATISLLRISGKSAVFGMASASSSMNRAVNFWSR